MFKKLASLLFEDEDITPEKEDEKVDLLKVKKQAESSPLKAQMDPQPLHQEALERTKKSSFENIVADEHPASFEDEAHPLENNDISEPRRSSDLAFVDRKPVQSKDVYEFKPVISPMFGVAESEKEHVRPTFVQTAEVKNDSHLQTVISPYYGAIHKDMKTGPEYQNNPVSMEPTQLKSKAKVAQYVEETKPIEIKNISLEELISPNPIPQTQNTPNTETVLEENIEDVTQFSLFGEE
ncbi:MAG: hypothetical protein HGB31_03690 [Erysipelotrichaceae bacterium]|nr:hypothetical protein [Erysipelotrichaceae bacterium]